MATRLRAGLVAAALLALTGCTSNGNRIGTMDQRLAMAEELAKEEFGHDRFVCEPEYITGSHIAKIVCMTNAQRQARAEANRGAVDSYYNNSSGKACTKASLC